MLHHIPSELVARIMGLRTGLIFEAAVKIWQKAWQSRVSHVNREFEEEYIFHSRKQSLSCRRCLQVMANYRDLDVWATTDLEMSVNGMCILKPCACHCANFSHRYYCHSNHLVYK